MSGFTLLSAWLGGMLVGSAAALLLWGAGRTAGVSGIAGGLLIVCRTLRGVPHLPRSYAPSAGSPSGSARLGRSSLGGSARDAGQGDWRWRAEFVLGLLVGGLFLGWLRPDWLGAPAGGLLALGIAGLLVGFGASLSGGCTSGHGICGLGRLSGRSLVAVLAFMFTGILTVALSRQIGLAL